MTRTQGYQIARTAMKKSDFSRCRTGAVAIYHGRVLAEGWNSERTSPLQAKYNRLRGFNGYNFKSSLHAEMMIVSKIRYLDINFKDVEIYCWRGEDGKSPLLSRPCAACMAALRNLGIRKFFYTGNGSFIREIYK